ncbi:hypothetical protein ZEAMMB73_Zm00001d002236 [Zea mays]|uniref:Uncharacterized protein n=1 Tax=Zea mays TaxID=4577 RepID=A0A1D6DXV8_MAIZE|nr:hypothetical protein ZEAMMB73_Zm00001d002236 [Zea mays]
MLYVKMLYAICEDETRSSSSGQFRFHFLSKMESVDQVASVLLITIRLDKTQSKTLSSSLLYVLLRFADQEKSPILGEVHMQYTNTKHTYRPITITMTDWNNITILPTCLSTIIMTRAEHVSIVK